MTSASAVDAFSQSYREARSKFLAAAEAAGLDVHAYVHPLLGREGEQLAIDVVFDGPAAAPALLMIGSGCHGVEGFCGSGVQVALLRDAAWRASAHEAGVAVLYAHALNPYGFSWLRRATHENVDLNRNFHDFSKPLPSNDGYDSIARLLVPATWPPPPANEQELMAQAAARGMRAIQEDVTAGQYKHPEGLHYGGVNPTWSNSALRHLLRDHARRCRRIGWIDLHSGLGACGHGERIYAGPAEDGAALARTRAWWGDAVTATHEGSSTSAETSGPIWRAVVEECPQAQFTGIFLEFGTRPMLEVLNAMRAEQWLENHPEADTTGQHDAIKRQLRDAFYIDTDEWKTRVVEQAFDAARQALRGLSAA